MDNVVYATRRRCLSSAYPAPDTLLVPRNFFRRVDHGQGQGPGPLLRCQAPGAHGARRAAEKLCKMCSLWGNSTESVNSARMNANAAGASYRAQRVKARLRRSSPKKQVSWVSKRPIS